MFSLLRPDIEVGSVVDVTVARLREAGVGALLLDVDCTLKRYGSEELLPGVVDWLGQVREAEIGLHLISNGGGSRIRQFAESVQIPFIAPAMKPLPFAIWRAIRLMNYNKKSTAMVGDQLFTDILAGKLAGVLTILVKPQGENEEPWFARIKRPLEKFLLKR
ncbi:MAG: YqeG family HAD IIIA-type phosphatase [Planctomycetaceae bacterium]|jgi:HAD superfamily phosphatase (TIGR01668 family)|nr:YqeG family HAD IIIA-type phosphatase [Planctomycetaceae bacterium]